jgi:hypothetical protein
VKLAFLKTLDSLILLLHYLVILYFPPILDIINCLFVFGSSGFPTGAFEINSEGFPVCCLRYFETKCEFWVDLNELDFINVSEYEYLCLILCFGLASLHSILLIPMNHSLMTREPLPIQLPQSSFIKYFIYSDGVVYYPQP